MNSINIGRYAIVNNYDLNCSFDMGEILYWKRVLTSLEQDRVKLYLLQKWQSSI
jgi:hypothetical protein